MSRLQRGPQESPERLESGFREKAMKALSITAPLINYTHLVVKTSSHKSWNVMLDLVEQFIFV